MKDQIKWASTPCPRATTGSSPMMALTNVAKARFFHSSFPSIPSPPGPAGRHGPISGAGRPVRKNESYRFGLNAFKVLGGSFAMAQYIARKWAGTSRR